MKCKILHLPTATFLYRIIHNKNDDNFDPDYLYSEFEITISYKEYSNIFPTKAIARNYINTWHKYGLTDLNNNFVWDELGNEGQLRKEHCQIIEVKDV